jgi:hypothetical protein
MVFGLPKTQMRLIFLDFKLSTLLDHSEVVVLKVMPIWLEMVKA